jgi:hypothetical protein
LNWPEIWLFLFEEQNNNKKREEKSKGGNKENISQKLLLVQPNISKLYSDQNTFTLI